MVRPSDIQNVYPTHTYKYTRLEASCIRVFTLLPGNHNSELQAALETVALRHAKEETTKGYEAVSYAWGSPTLSRSLKTPKGRIVIPRSLFVALRYLRYPDRPRRLWADCICISQTDGEERNEQVAMMPEIFGSALKVLVWLGLSQPEDGLAFAVLDCEKQMPHWTCDVEDLIPFLDHALRKQPWCGCCKARFFVQSSLGRAGLIAAKRLSHRAWFSRVWTLQEVCGALERVTFHSGNHIASLWSLREWFHRLHDIQRVTDQRYVTTNEFDRVRLIHKVWDVYMADRLRARSEDAMGLIIKLTGRSCSDPRDRIFAVRSLLQIQDVPSLRPDYTLHAAHVYRRFVVHIFLTSLQQHRHSKKDRDLHVAVVLGLCIPSHHDERSSQARIRSSWVPDFHAISSQADRKDLLYRNSTYMEVGCRPELWPFSRSSVRFNAVPASEDLCILRLRGRVFGNVKAVLGLSSFPRKIADLSDYRTVDLIAVSRIVKWHRAICAFLQIHLDGRDMYCRENDGLVRSFLACGVESGETPAEKLRAIRLLEICLRSMSHTEQYVDARRLQHRLAPVISSNYSRFAHLGRFAAVIAMPESRKKKLAWVPASSSEGDQVCICPGAPFPFVLRAAEGGMYRLQGDCWIHDISEAEAIGAPASMAESYEYLGSRHKSLSPWWERAVPKTMDLYGSDSAEDKMALEWEEANVGDILLC